jgi:hypothetical protein
VLTEGVSVLVVRTGTGFSEPVVYTDDVSMFMSCVFSIADVRHKNSASSRNTELKAFVLSPEFVSSALFRRCDTLTFRRCVRRHGLSCNPDPVSSAPGHLQWPNDLSYIYTLGEGT